MQVADSAQNLAKSCQGLALGLALVGLSSGLGCPVKQSEPTTKGNSAATNSTGIAPGAGTAQPHTGVDTNAQAHGSSPSTASSVGPDHTATDASHLSTADGQVGSDATGITSGNDTGSSTGLDATALLKFVKSPKTTDARAQKALDDARAANLPVRDLAIAANARGETLMITPERASAFFEWAARVDPVYPDATFNLAKLAANAGELDTCKTLLHEVKARGGKKLLKKVEFDPVFNALHDDPEVRALVK